MRAPRRALDLAAPESGAAVMGTGIVSVALALDGATSLSRILLAITAAMWLTLAALVLVRVAYEPVSLREQAHTTPALSWVAATSVLGTRLVFAGWTGAAIGLLGLAVALWALLIGPVLAHWRTPTTGGSLLLTVATQSLAVLSAELAARQRADWLEFAALVPFALGLVSYVFVMSRFDLRQLRVGRGDHWITGGALAISALAAGDIAAGARSLAVLGHGHGAVQIIAVGLWTASMLWLPALVFTEAIRPRLRYDVRRWSTVFPLGMYAACSFVVGDVARAGAITSFGRVWVWVALTGWAVVTAGMVRKLFAFGQDDPSRSA